MEQQSASCKWLVERDLGARRYRLENPAAFGCPSPIPVKAIGIKRIVRAAHGFSRRAAMGQACCRRVHSARIFVRSVWIAAHVNRDAASTTPSRSPSAIGWMERKVAPQPELPISEG